MEVPFQMMNHTDKPGMEELLQDGNCDTSCSENEYAELPEKMKNYVVLSTSILG